MRHKNLAAHCGVNPDTFAVRGIKACEMVRFGNLLPALVNSPLRVKNHAIHIKNYCFFCHCVLSFFMIKNLVPIRSIYIRYMV